MNEKVIETDDGKDMFDIDMNDPWVQMYAQLPHHEKIDGKWYYVHFGGEMLSEVSEEEAKRLEEDRQRWNEEWEKLVKELEGETDGK